MFELDTRKDHLITMVKLCGATLSMWTRDHFFPPWFAQAGWDRLQPFINLPGTITITENRTVMTFSGFNDRQLNAVWSSWVGRSATAHLSCRMGRRSSLKWHSAGSSVQRHFRRPSDDNL